jgi:hypothetical protein
LTESIIPKILHWEACAGSRENLKNVVKVDSRTSYGGNLDFCRISYKPGEIDARWNLES